MRVISLHAEGWTSPDDFYCALLPQLEAPSWHGRNLDALADSLSGGINRVEPPFRVEIKGVENLGREMRQFLLKVATAFNDVRAETQADITFEIEYRKARLPSKSGL